MSEFVISHYDSAPEREWQRLQIGLSRIELAATLRLTDQYFPETGAVCDIGGGPGRYCIELCKRGYQVTLFDLSEKLLRRAEQAFAAAGMSGIRVVHGDARDLRVFEDESFDAALCLGPPNIT